MSYTIRTDIFCNIDGCNHWIHEGTVGIPEKTQTNKIAAKEGWIKRNFLDGLFHSDREDDKPLTKEQKFFIDGFMHALEIVRLQ